MPLLANSDGAPPTYRTTGTGAKVLVTLLILPGVAGAAAMAGAFPKAGGWTFAAIAAPIILSTIAIIVLLIKIDRRRRRSVGAVLLSDGFTVNLKPDEAAKAAAFEPVAHLTDLRFGATKIGWCASRGSGGATVTILEHEYLTGSGKSQQTHTHTVVAWPIPPAWPSLMMRRTGGLARWVDGLRKVQDIEVGDAAFDKAWRVQSSDEPFARYALTAPLRALLANSPKAEFWVLEQGRACCLFKGALDGANVKIMFERSQRFLAAVPKDAWTWAAQADPSARPLWTPAS